MPELVGSNPSQSEKAEKAEKKQTAKERQKWEKEDKKTKAAEGASPRTDGKTRRHHPERSKKKPTQRVSSHFCEYKAAHVVSFFSFNFALFKRFRF